MVIINYSLALKIGYMSLWKQMNNNWRDQDEYT